MLQYILILITGDIMTNMISQNHDGNAEEAPRRIEVLEKLVHRAAAVKFVPEQGSTGVFYQAVYTIYSPAA